MGTFSDLGNLTIFINGASMELGTELGCPPLNFFMVENCEIFKITFGKILDFMHRLKIRSRALTRYK